jgi:hypothetical protein
MFSMCFVAGTPDSGNLFAGHFEPSSSNHIGLLPPMTSAHRKQGCAFLSTQLAVRSSYPFKLTAPEAAFTHNSFEGIISSLKLKYYFATSSHVPHKLHF